MSLAQGRGHEVRPPRGLFPELENGSGAHSPQRPLGRWKSERAALRPSTGMSTSAMMGRGPGVPEELRPRHLGTRHRTKGEGSGARAV